MKKISVLMITGILLLYINVAAFAQTKSQSVKASIIEPYKLTITHTKTTNLIFAYPIKSVDKGSRDILVQKASGIENILQVKAALENFPETNLTVVTSDGKLYSFIVNYAKTPASLNFQFANQIDKSQPTAAAFTQENNNEAILQNTAKWIAKKGKVINGSKDKNYGMRLQLQGIYIKDDVIFCRLGLKNRSNINYHIDQLRFFIRDQKKSKRTAIQEIEINPLLVNTDTSVIDGRSKHVLVFALPKFTIPDKKYLAIQMMEKSGGRHLELKVRNRTIVNAIPIRY